MILSQLSTSYFRWFSIAVLWHFVVFACQNAPIETAETTNVIKIEYDEPPNILWLVAEDLSAYLPMFGDSTIETPNLSRLAAEGVCFDKFFSPAPVCSPARSAIATGMYPSRIKSNQMRTGPWFKDSLSVEEIAKYVYIPNDFSPYEVVLPVEVKMMSEQLRRAGYYCTNNAKRDYQFISPVTAWDESSTEAHWRNRPDDKPFFAVFNFEVTHESRIWTKKDDSLWIDENLPVEVPPYLPDTETGKRDVRRMYSNIKEMDAQVGDILQQLEEDGLLDNTVIFWYSDHGGPLPRQKRLLYDSGIHVPLIVRFPQQQFAMQRDSQLLSFIDLAPTALSLANIEPPNYMDGESFLGQYQSNKERKYIFAAADRFDKIVDANRAVRDQQYKYIRYFYPRKPMLLPVAYREQMPIMQELNRLAAADSLTSAQALWYRKTKPEEELFDTWNDPHELTNLADNPTYQKKLEELREACTDWMKRMNDDPLQAEAEIATAMWNGASEHPQTATPTINVQNGKIELNSATEGASIGYKFTDQAVDNPDFSNWQIYTEPFEPKKGQTLWVRAHRIGYKGTTAAQYMTQ